MTMQQAISECQPCITGTEPDCLAFVEVDKVPVGFVQQYYPWSALTDELVEMNLSVPDGPWGLDIYIGESDWVSSDARSVTSCCSVPERPVPDGPCN